MTLHLNSYGLNQKGFRLVASYVSYEKGRRALNIECYSNGTEYLIRTWFTGKSAWDNIYTDKNVANKRINELIHTYSCYKRLV